MEAQAPMLKDEVIEQVRVNLLRFLEQYRTVTTSVVAKETGYSVKTIQMFCSNTIVTMPVAMSIVAAYPEIGDGLVCPHCGAIRHIWRK